MLAKTCPWCGAKCSPSQLGSRPAGSTPKWYQFSRNVRVCPFCAGAVKLGGRGIGFMLLALPLFLATMTELFTAQPLFTNGDINKLVWGLGIAGFICTYLFCDLEKVENT